MLAHRQFLNYIIRPVLQDLKLHSQSAENLLIGTALAESNLSYIAQIGNGPALSVFQIEPATHDDVFKNFLDYRPELHRAVMRYGMGAKPEAWWMTGNMYYATAIARMVYYRDPHPLPDADDVPGLARYWKRVYNTRLGAGEASHFIRRYNRVILNEG